MSFPHTARLTAHFGLFIFACLLLFAPLRSPAAEHLPRTWTNSLGIKMEATFVRVEGNQITLLLNSGQMVTMPADKFSAADQDYIHTLQTTAAATPAPANPTATDTTAATSSAADSQPPAQQLTPAPPHARSILLRPPLMHAPDPRVRPQAEIYVQFPELGKCRTGEPMGMRIRIPASYSPDRPIPLILWLSPGDGNDRFNTAMDLVDPEQFILVGMNYPADPIPDPRISAKTGHIDKVWAYEEKMIAKLQDMIPNIDPRLRVAAGFSNGAHTIGGCLAQGQDGITYFNVFILIEGGISDKYDYPTLPGRYYYIAWGDTSEGRGYDFGNMLAGYARKAGMKVEAHPMPGIGHDFPDSEKAKVKAWLRDVVIPAQLAKP